MPTASNRRDFLKASALAGIGVFIAGKTSLADDKITPATLPSNKLNVACIGVGGKGDSDSNDAGKYANIVAICDVDKRYLDKKSHQFPDAKTFVDYREMLTNMGDKIDAVVVSTPDHTHAPASLMAMNMGKHVYCQKPMTHTVAESRAMRDAARKNNVITQLGNQGTASDEFRRGVEILRAGVLGQVKEVHVWTNRPIWPQAPDVNDVLKEQPIPATLDWDKWIGSSPMRPYNAGYHPFKWRGFRDFGTGALGDMGCHTYNLPFMGLDLDYPTTVEAEAGDINPQTYPSWAKVTSTFAANAKRGPVKVIWWEGHKKDKTGTLVRNIPGHNITHGFDLPQSGSLMIGDAGMMMSISDYGYGLRLIFNADSDGYSAKIPQSLPRTGGGDDKQKLEWINAIKNRGYRPLSNFDHASLLTEFILLGNVAISSGKKLEWDGPNMKITNDAAANALLTRDYRDGWKVL
jgi:predicted dehydrogenase